MKGILNVDIEDIIKNTHSAESFNNEVIIVQTNGQAKMNRDELVQMDAFWIFLVFDGTLDIIINSKEYHVDSKVLIQIMEIHAVRQIHRSDDFRGLHVMLSHNLMAEMMRGIKHLSVSNLLSCFDNPIIELRDEESVLFESILSNVVRNINQTSHVYQRELIKNELRGLMLELSNIVVQRSKIPEAYRFKSKEAFMTQFMLLVSKHCREEHSVEFYAQKLCVETKYLSRILKAVGGKTASVWIDEAIIIEARILLKNTEYTIQQIVDILHFSDQSSFGKFFKKHCGVSPASFRRMHDGTA